LVPSRAGIPSDRDEREKIDCERSPPKAIRFLLGGALLIGYGYYGISFHA
jgi:hypothetical protein